MGRARIADYQQLVRDAAAIAKEVGQRSLVGHPTYRAIEFDSPRDVKITADRENEALIVGLLRERSDTPILGEEGGWYGQAQGSGLFWVVDPLDGSYNFYRGLRQSAISIGLVEGGSPVAGVVYDIFADELTTGVLGLGTWCNGQPSSVSTNPRESSVLMTGFPARRSFDEASIADFARNAGSWKKVRMIGSAALSLTSVALGRADAYSEDSIMFWDTAGGCALVAAAGGQIRLDFESFDEPGNVFAWNGQWESSAW